MAYNLAVSCAGLFQVCGLKAYKPHPFTQLGDVVYLAQLPTHLTNIHMEIGERIDLRVGLMIMSGPSNIT